MTTDERVEKLRRSKVGRHLARWGFEPRVLDDGTEQFLRRREGYTSLVCLSGTCAPGKHPPQGLSNRVEVYEFGEGEEVPAVIPVGMAPAVGPLVLERWSFTPLEQAEFKVGQAQRLLEKAQADSLKWAERRSALRAGSSRARVTTANAGWMRAAEHRDRMAALVAERLARAERELEKRDAKAQQESLGLNFTAALKPNRVENRARPTTSPASSTPRAESWRTPAPPDPTRPTWGEKHGLKKLVSDGQKRAKRKDAAKLKEMAQPASYRAGEKP